MYSPLGIAAMATEMGLKGGWGLDLTNRDSDGKNWDSSKPNMRRQATEKISKDKPRVTAGSPACTDWSTMMDLN